MTIEIPVIDLTPLREGDIAQRRITHLTVDFGAGTNRIDRYDPVALLLQVFHREIARSHPVRGRADHCNRAGFVQHAADQGIGVGEGRHVVSPATRSSAVAVLPPPSVFAARTILPK